MSSEDRELLEGFREDIILLEKEKQLYSRSPDIDWAESILSRSTVSRLRRETCLQLLLKTSLILIDTVDYSRTDRRRMATDLESIYALWSKIASSGGPTILFAVQKELSDGHFFLDKARRFEIEPLAAEQLVEAYQWKFHGSAPFTEEGLLKLARMSRGVFRRFLNYILLALDLFETHPEESGEINADLVARAVPVERIVEDMEVELSRLFPKNSGLTSVAVRLILLLEERGEMMQGELTGLLNVEDYTLSRLLAKLEDARYVTRRREGNDKIVALRPRRMIQTPSDAKVVV